MAVGELKPTIHPITRMAAEIATAAYIKLTMALSEWLFERGCHEVLIISEAFVDVVECTFPEPVAPAHRRMPDILLS